MRLFSALIMSAVFGSPVMGCDVKWDDLGPTPLSPAYIPQGLSQDRKGLLLTLYSDNHIPNVRIFRYSGEWIELKGDTAPLVHTSGIVPFGGKYFLIDYESGLIARASIQGNNFDIEAVFQTGITSISAGFVFTDNINMYLSVSKFSLFGSYAIFPVDTLMSAIGGEIEPIKTISGSSFIQGNFSNRNYILQSRNRIGRDAIDIGSAAENGRLQFHETVTFVGKMIEDITIFGDDLYVTDEESFKLYAARNFLDCVLSDS